MTAENQYSIGEISQITGIKAVTLRAWQRRYGLVKPKRTGKGHRLFDQQDLERIRQILAWLNKGVSIGQVKALLQEPSATSVEPAHQSELNTLLNLSCHLQLAALDHQLDELMRLYPTELLHQQIIQPWLNELDQLQRPDAQMIRDCAQQVWAELLYRTLNIPGARQSFWGVIEAGKNPSTSMLMARHELQAQGQNSRWLGSVNLSQFRLVQDRLPLKGCLILLGYGLTESNIVELNQWPEPCILIGQPGQLYKDNGWLQRDYDLHIPAGLDRR